MDYLIRKYNKVLHFLNIHPKYEFSGRKHCSILKSHSEIDKATQFLYRKGFESHVHQCKDWDLANIIFSINDGNFLDMGSSDSSILKNISILKIRGEIYGIDLREPIEPVKDVQYITGNLMDTKLPSNYFNNITCLSVIEHEVDIKKFVKEISRLLQTNGKVFITFDYWEPKIETDIKLYELEWQPLDKQTVKELIAECEHHNLYLVEDMNWTIGDAVINKDYYSPDPSVSYTFAMVTFEKRPNV